MSKFDVDNFVTPPDPDLICCICRNVLCNPLESPCQHVFCRGCITTWLAMHRTCPSCRKTVCQARLRPVLPIVRNMINRLLVKCQNASRGCSQGVKLESFERHVKECEFALVGCLNSGCVKNVLRRDMLRHERECQHRLVRCTRGCGLPVTAAKMHVHNCIRSLKNSMKLMEQTFNKRLKDLENKMLKSDEELWERVKGVEAGLLDESYNTDVQFNRLREELHQDGYLGPSQSRSRSRSHSRSRSSSYSSTHSYRSSHNSYRSSCSPSPSRSPSQSPSYDSESPGSSDRGHRGSPLYQYESPRDDWFRNEEEWENTSDDEQSREQSPGEGEEGSWHGSYSPEFSDQDSPNAEFSPVEEDNSPVPILVPSSGNAGQSSSSSGQSSQAATGSSQAARDDVSASGSGASTPEPPPDNREAESRHYYLRGKQHKVPSVTPSGDGPGTSAAGPSQADTGDATGCLYGVRVGNTDTEDEDWQPEVDTISSGVTSETSDTDVADDGRGLSGSEQQEALELTSDRKNTRTSTKRRMPVGDSESQDADKPSTSRQSGTQDESAGDRDTQNTDPTTRGHRRRRNGDSEDEDTGGKRCKKKAKRK